MLDEQAQEAVVALTLGAVAGVALFVPFVAASYRRRGTLTAGRTVLWAAALVYFWAIWTYTLLPLPDPDAIRCAGHNVNPLAFVDDIHGALGRAGGRPLRALSDVAVLQLLLNVLLFAPLGFLLRVIGGRGVAVAGAVGLALSAFVETTQLTGVWGLYSCAYRVFDVDDMLTNTVGALLGSLLALVVPRRHRGRGTDGDAEAPRPVTRPRRLLAMVSDLVGFLLTTAAVAVAIRGWQVYLGDGEPVSPGPLGPATALVIAAVAGLVPVLATGGTVGDLAVRLRYTGGPLPAAPSRLLRYLGGIGGYALLLLLPGRWSALASAYLVLAVLFALGTRRGRGLPGLFSGQQLTDARKQADAILLGDSETGGGK